MGVHALFISHPHDGTPTSTSIAKNENIIVVFVHVIMQCFPNKGMLSADGTEDESEAIMEILLLLL